MKHLAGQLLHGADYNYEQWLDRPDILDDDIRCMKKAGVNVVSVGIFSWAMIEREEGVYTFGWLDGLFDRMNKAGISVILATPSGSKPAWLSQKYPEVCRMSADGQREHHGTRHNHCRTSPVYREKCRAVNERLAQRYKDNPALIMWHVSNEYNGMPCYCPSCMKAFHLWLEKKYGTLENLNKAWWTAFWSHTYTSWDQIFPDDPSIHALMIDWHRFTSDQTIDFYLDESEPLRRITPDIPVTTNFMQPDVWLDYHKFAQHVDVISWDSYPAWHKTGSDIDIAVKTAFYHDLARSYKKKNFLLMESTPSATNWQGSSKPKKPGMHLLSSLQAAAHGSDSVQYFQWRQSRGGEEKFHGAVMTHLGTDDTAVFRDVCSVGRALEKLSPLFAPASAHHSVSAASSARAAVLYDFQNSWALDEAKLPLSTEKNYQQECIRHYSSLWKAGIACDIIGCAEEHLETYRFIVVPMLYMFHSNIAEKLRSFVHGGGTVVATYLTGLVDENDLCFLGGTPGGLTDMFGICTEFTDTVTAYEKQTVSMYGRDYRVYDYADCLRAPPAADTAWTPGTPPADCAVGQTAPSPNQADLAVSAAHVCASFSAPPLAGRPAVTRAQYGKGTVYYHAARFEQQFLDDFYRDTAGELACVSWTIPRGISVRQRTGSDGLPYLFVMNFTEEKILIDPRNANYYDMLSECDVSGPFTMEPFGVRILKFSAV